MQHVKLSFLTINLLSFIYGGNVLASVDITPSVIFIESKANQWFSDLRQDVITHTPAEDSKIAEWDRLVSNEYQKTMGDRLKLAEADKNQDHSYVYSTYIDRVFGDGSRDNNIKKSESFKKIEQLYKLATYVKDPNTSKNRSIDFILKDDFRRGRPYQVLDKDGNYKDDYTSINGSSFPSGHTFNGFKQAVTLAVLFPEKADEIFDRAIEYGESRVIVGAHFGTDTIASRVVNYYTLAQLLSNNDIAKTFVDLAKDTRINVEISCGKAVKDCLTQSSKKNNEETGYYKKKDSETVAKLTVDQVPEKASALLRLRFPYLKSEQMREILASTAYPINSLAGWNYDKSNVNSTWGLINLPKAFNGPTNFTSDFVVHQNEENLTYDIGDFTTFDIWKNNIDGLGGLVKKGDGTLVLAGHNTFDRAIIESGALILTGTNEYKNKSQVRSGTLVVSGELNSDLDVGNKGVLELLDGEVNAHIVANKESVVRGNGVVQSLDLRSGSIISPGNIKIGNMHIKDSINFEKGSTYLVNVFKDTSGGLIESDNKAIINGGTIKILLENTKNLLSENEVRSFIGLKYKVLNAKNGLKGKFDFVDSNYLFISTNLEYSGQDAVVCIGRNSRKLSDIADTRNSQHVAEAIDGLNVGNPILESVIVSTKVGEVNQAFNAFSGQVYADVISNQLVSSHYLRDAGLNRLQSLITEDNQPQRNLWADYVYAEQNVSKDTNATGYKASTNGFFLGGEADVINDQIKVGLMGGYTHSSIDADMSSAKSDNFHLGIYGGTQLDKLTFKAGYGYTLHDLNTQRSVAYMYLFDKNKVSYKAYSNQLFAETGYALQFKTMFFEPFMNLSNVNFSLKSAKENGGVTALKLKHQNTDLITSTMGVHFANQLKLSNSSVIALKGTLGWQHYFSDLNHGAHLAFSNGGTSFNVNAVSFARDGAVVNLSSEISVKNNVSISLGYNGLISNKYKDNSVKANLTWTF